RRGTAARTPGRRRPSSPPGAPAGAGPSSGARRRRGRASRRSPGRAGVVATARSGSAGWAPCRAGTAPGRRPRSSPGVRPRRSSPTTRFAAHGPDLETVAQAAQTQATVDGRLDPAPERPAREGLVQREPDLVAAPGGRVRAPGPDARQQLARVEALRADP